MRTVTPRAWVNCTAVLLELVVVRGGREVTVRVREGHIPITPVSFILVGLQSP